MSISIAIPAYNEEGLIADTVQRVDDCLSGLGCAYEILVGDDGSSDRTGDAARSLGLPHVRVIARQHEGKGAILTASLQAATGGYLGFIDADLEIDPAHIPELVQALDDGYDAAVASKVLDATLERERSLSRRLSTRVYNGLVRLGFGSRLTDHQAGLKLFRAEALRAVLPDVRSSGWSWDTEVLVALLDRGVRIKEIPVQTTTVRDSHVGLLRTGWQMFWNLGRLWIRFRILPS